MRVSWLVDDGGVGVEAKQNNIEQRLGISEEAFEQEIKKVPQNRCKQVLDVRIRLRNALSKSKNPDHILCRENIAPHSKQSHHIPANPQQRRALTEGSLTSKTRHCGYIYRRLSPFTPSASAARCFATYV